MVAAEGAVGGGDGLGGRAALRTMCLPTPRPREEREGGEGEAVCGEEEG